MESAALGSGVYVAFHRLGAMECDCICICVQCKGKWITSRVGYNVKSGYSKLLYLNCR